MWPMCAMIGQTGKSVNPRSMSAMERVVSGISGFFVRERGKILLLLGMFLVGAISFQAGFLEGGSVAAKPVIVEKPDPSGCPGGEAAGVSAGSAASGKAGAKSVSPAPISAKDCRFVGSRNSTLYHLPTCASAKRIKPENLVCFVSEEDAQSKGYKAGCVK